MARIAVVLPTFTAAAYNYVHDNFYDWYAAYIDYNSEDVPANIKDLTQYVPTTATDLANPKILYTPPAQAFAQHLGATRPNDTVTVVQDVDVHNGVLENFDVAFIFHEEYVTQQEYTNFKNFVQQQGGLLVVMDGNVLFAEVDYNSTKNTVELITGHYWRQISTKGGTAYTTGPGEVWKIETATWMGSNSDAAPDIEHFAYLGTTIENNPFGYPVCPNMSGVENQYRYNSNDVVLVDYKATVNPEYATYLGPISTYYLDSGRGRSLVMGLMTDVIQTNPTFLSFFDSIFERYGMKRSTAPYTSTFPSVAPMIPPAHLAQEKKALEDKIRRKMGMPPI